MRTTSAVGLVLALLAPPTLAAPPPCKGSVSGSVSGSFTCAATVFARDGEFYFELASAEMPKDVLAWQPGTFTLDGPPAARTYTLDTLGPGMSRVAKEGGTLFTATKTGAQRGEVTLVLRAVKAGKEKGIWQVHGTYRARLLPVGAGKTGEVVVEAKF
jgi:hypothetical protein